MSAPSRARAWMCVSSRRRPITSPPGGGTIARPQRASSGPASRTEARIREQSSSSSSVFVSSAAWIRTSFGPIHSASAPRSAISSTIVSTSRIRGTFRSTTGSGLSRQPARIGSAPFLFPAARIVPLKARPPSMTEDVVEGVLSHAEHLALPRDTLLKKALFACDELSGFVHACALVRPTGLDGLEPKSVRKKLKQPSFAAGVHRDEVYKGAEELGVELDDHIRTVVAAMQPMAHELGLRTAADAA